MFRKKNEQVGYHQLGDSKNEEKTPQKSSFGKICTKIGVFAGAAKALYTMPAYVIYNGVKRVMDEHRLSVEQDGLLDYMYNKCLPVAFWCSPDDSLDCCSQSSFLSCNLDGQSNPCSDVFDAFKICNSEKALRFSAICSSVYNPTGYWIIGSGIVLTVIATAGLVAYYQWDKKNNGTEDERHDVLEQPFSAIIPAEAKPSPFGKCKNFLSCGLFKAKTPSISRETSTQDLTQSASIGASMV